MLTSFFSSIHNSNSLITYDPLYYQSSWGYSTTQFSLRNHRPQLPFATGFSVELANQTSSFEPSTLWILFTSASQAFALELSCYLYDRCPYFLGSRVTDVRGRHVRRVWFVSSFESRSAGFRWAGVTMWYESLLSIHSSVTWSHWRFTHDAKMIRETLRLSVLNEVLNAGVLVFGRRHLTSCWRRKSYLEYLVWRSATAMRNVRGVFNGMSHCLRSVMLPSCSYIVLSSSSYAIFTWDVWRSTAPICWKIHFHKEQNTYCYVQTFSRLYLASNKSGSCVSFIRESEWIARTDVISASCERYCEWHVGEEGSAIAMRNVRSLSVRLGGWCGRCLLLCLVTPCSVSRDFSLILLAVLGGMYGDRSWVHCRKNLISWEEEYGWRCFTSFSSISPWVIQLLGNDSFVKKGFLL